MREPKYECRAGADWDHVSVHIFKTMPEQFALYGRIISRAEVMEVRDDLAAAIAWYEARKAEGK